MSDDANLESVESTPPPGEDSVEPEKADLSSYRAGQKSAKAWRFGVLVAGLALITGIGYMHQTGVPFKVVGVDALCPFGGIETLWSLISGAGLVTKIAASSVILLVITLATAFVFRRAFCGYICPLGALQELFGTIGKAIWRGKRPTVPASLDKPARWLKYGVFVVFTVWTWQAATLVIRPYDPWVAWMHLTSAEVFAEFSIGLAILGVSLVGSIVYERFFCKYLCPMGAFLGAISPLSVFKVNREESTCIDCKACDKACPVNLTVSEAAPAVTSPECINCNECVNVCPVPATLTVSSAASSTGRFTISPAKMLMSVSAIIALLLVLTTASGAFAWTMPGLAPAAGAAAVSKVPDINVEDIKGSMTVAEVAAATTIPAKAFEAKFGITEAEMSEKIKDLAPKHDFDVHTDFREFITAELKRMRAEESAAPAGGAASPEAGTAD
ncbi:MAG: 4Fe-4S binding protein [Coriobacteriia bacterium]|nr:4Fe-4S binding protein [Coriobacteriia bacterium]